MRRTYHQDGTQPTDPDTVFVFGSNLAGIHGGGAARAAYNHFGAQWGVGAGPTGRAFAIPTKACNVRESLAIEQIQFHVASFLYWAQTHPDTQFFVTRIGCGLAGYTDEDIAPMFDGAPLNCNLPAPWARFYGD